MRFVLNTVCAVVVLASCANAFFINMTRQDYIDVDMCISDARCKALCKKLFVCYSYAPESALAALDVCYAQYNPDGNKECKDGETIYPNEKVPGEIIDCIVKKIGETPTEEEKKQTIKVETCLQDLSNEANCPVK